MSSDPPSTKQLIGAALLAAGRPVKASELSELTGLGEEALLRQINDLKETLRSAGIDLEAVAGGYRLFVPAALGNSLSPVLSPPALPQLSRAALEVLAVIAYKQPITRAEIEAMRGGSSAPLVTLQERELVKAVGRSEAIGQPILYGTTQKFLLEFGLSSLKELPPLAEEGFAELLRS